MGIHSGHRQRLKNRFLAEGLDHFEPHEVLELLLYYGIPMKDTNPIAHELIARFGSISAVLDAPYERLKEIPDMTDNAAVLVSMIPDVVRRYSLDKATERRDLGSLVRALGYLKSRMANVPKEEMRLLCLDSENKLIRDLRLGTGTVNRVSLFIRELHEAVLMSNAVNVVIAHNHPSGNPVPSIDDMRTTKTVINSLSYIDVNVYDHVIVAGKEHFSFAQNRILDGLRRECAPGFTLQMADVNRAWLVDSPVVDVPLLREMAEKV